MKNKTTWNTVFVLLLFGISASGCDQIKSLTDSFTKKKTAPKTQVHSTPSALPAPQPEAKSAQPLPPMPANALARVGSWTISIEEFKDRLQALKKEVPEYDITNVELNKNILQNLVNQRLLVQDAERSGVADKEEIARAVEELRNMLLAQEVVAKITANISATEEEAKQYYEDNAAAFTAPAQWQIREIVVEKEEEAKQILIEIMNGADFGETAKAKSKTKSSWKKGDLGLVSTFEFPKMESVVNTLEVGGVSSVFKGPEGYYIVKLEEKKGGEKRPFEEIKEALMNEMTVFKQQEAVGQYLEQIRKNTVVEVNEKLLEG